MGQAQLHSVGRNSPGESQRAWTGVALGGVAMGGDANVNFGVAKAPLSTASDCYTHWIL